MRTADGGARPRDAPPDKRACRPPSAGRRSSRRRSAVFSHGAATAARRRRRSRARPGSPSRSSTATSRRSASSTSRVSTRRGRPLRRGVRDAKLEELGDAECGRRRSGSVARLHAAGGSAAESLDPGSDRGGGGRGDRAATCAGTCARCTTSSPTASGGRRRRAASPADRDPEAEAWIFVAGVLLLSVGDRLGGLLGAGRLRRIAAERHPLAVRRRLEHAPRSRPGRRAPGRRSRRFRGLGADRDLLRRSRSCLRPVLNAKRPRLRLRGRSVRQAATRRHSERRDSAANHGPSVAAVAPSGGAPLHSSLASAVQVGLTVGALSGKVK